MIIDWQHVLEIAAPTVFVAGAAWGGSKNELRNLRRALSDHALDDAEALKTFRRETADALRVYQRDTASWREAIDRRFDILVNKLIPNTRASQ